MKREDCAFIPTGIVGGDQRDTRGSTDSLSPFFTGRGSRGEGLSPRALMRVDRPVPPHPPRESAATSPRKRGEVEESAPAATPRRRGVWQGCGGCCVAPDSSCCCQGRRCAER